MNRAEELTLKLVDDDLGPSEALELEELIRQDPEAADIHLALLQQEAMLRGQTQRPDLSTAVDQRIRRSAQQRIEQGVMTRIGRQTDRPVIRYAVAASILLLLGVGLAVMLGPGRTTVSELEMTVSGHWQVTPGTVTSYDVSVRNGRRERPLSGAEVELAVVDSAGRAICTAEVTTDADGWARSELAIPADVAEGAYDLRGRAASSKGTAELEQGLSISPAHAAVLDWGLPQEARSPTFAARLADSGTGREAAETRLAFAPVFLPLPAFLLVMIAIVVLGLRDLTIRPARTTGRSTPRLGWITGWWLAGFGAPLTALWLRSETLSIYAILAATVIAATVIARDRTRGPAPSMVALVRRDGPLWALVIGIPGSLYLVWIITRFSLGWSWHHTSLALITASAIGLLVYAVALATRPVLPTWLRWLERASSSLAVVTLTLASLRSIVWHFEAQWLSLGYVGLVLAVLWRECTGRNGTRTPARDGHRALRWVPMAFALAWLAVIALGGDGYIAMFTLLDVFGVGTDTETLPYYATWSESGPNRMWVAYFAIRALGGIFVAAAVVAGALLAGRLRTMAWFTPSRVALASVSLTAALVLPLVLTSRLPVGGPASKAVGAASAEQKNLVVYSGLGIPESLAPPDRAAAGGDDDDADSASPPETWRAPSSRHHGNEEYDDIVDNPFVATSHHPLSTFAVDVDTAAYANVRRYLDGWQLPPHDAVRVEELINYFGYDYAPPTGGAPFAVHTEVAGCPWNSEHRLVRIGLKGMEVTREQRPPTNLVFLLDVSGSMKSPDKLGLVRRAMRSLIYQLDERDRVSIVVYAGAAGVVLPNTPGDRQAEILGAVDRLSAGGSTAGGEGIELAYAMATAHYIEGGVNRVIMATDGDFNVGITDRGDLVRLIEREAGRGVFLTVLGVGTGHLKDSTMEQLADHGDGMYAYLDRDDEARKVLVEGMLGTLVTIARDVKVQVEFNPVQVAGYRLIGYENRLMAAEDFDDDTRDAGEIGSGHTVTALYEVIPASAGAPTTTPTLVYQGPGEPTEAALTGELLRLSLRYKWPEEDDSELITVGVSDGGGGGHHGAPPPGGGGRRSEHRLRLRGLGGRLRHAAAGVAVSGGRELGGRAGHGRRGDRNGRERRRAGRLSGLGPALRVRRAGGASAGSRPLSGGRASPDSAPEKRTR